MADPARARGPRTRPARCTPTSRAASSAPRSSATTSSSPPRARSPTSARRASSGWRARTTRPRRRDLPLPVQRGEVRRDGERPGTPSAGAERPHDGATLSSGVFIGSTQPGPTMSPVPPSAPSRPGLTAAASRPCRRAGSPTGPARRSPRPATGFWPSRNAGAVAPIVPVPGVAGSRPPAARTSARRRGSGRSSGSTRPRPPRGSADRGAPRIARNLLGVSRSAGRLDGVEDAGHALGEGGSAN